MKTEHQLLDSIRSKVRQRFLFVSAAVLSYSTLVLCYTDRGGFLRELAGDSAISGGLILFLGLIVLLLLLEYIFLVLNKEK